MSYDDYTLHICQKLKVIVSFAIIRAKPDHLTTNQYLEQLKNNMAEKNMADDAISITSDDFNINSSTEADFNNTQFDTQDNNNNDDTNVRSNNYNTINNSYGINMPLNNSSKAINNINEALNVTVNNSNKNGSARNNNTDLEKTDTLAIYNNCGTFGTNNNVSHEISKIHKENYTHSQFHNDHTYYNTTASYKNADLDQNVMNNNPGTEINDNNYDNNRGNSEEYNNSPNLLQNYNDYSVIDARGNNNYIEKSNFQNTQLLDLTQCSTLYDNTYCQRIDSQTKSDVIGKSKTEIAKPIAIITKTWQQNNIKESHFENDEPSAKRRKNIDNDNFLESDCYTKNSAVLNKSDIHTDKHVKNGNHTKFDVRANDAININQMAAQSKTNNHQTIVQTYNIENYYKPANSEANIDKTFVETDTGTYYSQSQPLFPITHKHIENKQNLIELSKQQNSKQTNDNRTIKSDTAIEENQTRTVLKNDTQLSKSDKIVYSQDLSETGLNNQKSTPIIGKTPSLTIQTLNQEPTEKFQIFTKPIRKDSMSLTFGDIGNPNYCTQNDNNLDTPTLETANYYTENDEVIVNQYSTLKHQSLKETQDFKENDKTLHKTTDLNEDNAEKDCSFDSNETLNEVVPFKILGELNKIKCYLNRCIDNSNDTGYKSNSQSSSKTSQSNQWLNQSAHSLFIHISTCPLVANTQDIVQEIAAVLGQLIDRMHEEETYPSFLEELLDTTNIIVKLVLNEDAQVLKKEEYLQRILLLTKSVHIKKFLIEKITNLLENLYEKLTNGEDIQNIVELENSCYIFNLLYTLLQNFDKKSTQSTQSTQNTQNSQEVIKKSDISDIWRKKWNPALPEQPEGEQKCVLLQLNKVLSKIIVSCVDGYSLIAYFALKCFNLLQN